MTLEIFQVDAFTNKLFSGNPAAVVPLEKWLPDKVMQRIAAENNLSETAFFVNEDSSYKIRWMTPSYEVPLCGHATLATSYLIFNVLKMEESRIEFNSKSGTLVVTKNENLISMNFPINRPIVSDCDDDLIKSVAFKPVEVLRNEAFILVYENEETIKHISPDFALMKKSAGDSVIITAPGNQVDFVSRFFAPEIGLNEDPVTGYAHTLLTPYWAEKLNKDELTATQLSNRGGDLKLKYLKDRVEISGEAVLYLKGEITI